MTRKIVMLLGFTLFLGSFAFCQDIGLDDFALQACLSNCYNTYSPIKSTSQFYDCLLRCKSTYEERDKKLWRVPG